MLKKVSALITVLLVSIVFLSTTVFATTTYQMNKKHLVVLVEFTETSDSLSAYPNNVNSDGTLKYDGSIKNNDTYYSNLFFGTTGDTLRNYYRETSDGKLNYIPAEETSGVANDGVVRVKLPIPHPNEYQTDGDTINCLTYLAQTKILNALFVAGQTLDTNVDFSQFDLNSDNSVSLSGIDNDELNISLVLASGDNKPHTREFCNITSFDFDNKHMVGDIAFDNANTDLGTFCHETGHLRGAVDLYKQSIPTYISSLSLMFDNEYCSHLDPYHNIKLGFVSPTIVTSSGNYTVNAINPTNPGQYNVLKIPIPCEVGYKEYFLVENRQMTGFDSGIDEYAPGGILIWHVKEAPSHFQYIRVERAGIAYLSSDGLPVSPYLYNGVSGSNTFGPNTTPSNSKSFSGDNGIVTITVNSPSSSSMSVNVKLLTPPQNFKVTADGTNVRLSWDPNEDAVEYAISKDNGQFISVGSSTSYLLPQSIGKHSYKLRVTDINGGVVETKELDTKGVIFGDVDRDGAVTSSDKSLILDYLLDTSISLTDTQMLVADVNGSGNIDSVDYSLVASYLDGSISQSPVGQYKVVTYGDVNGDGLITSQDYDIVKNNPDGPNGEHTLTDFTQRVAAQVSYCDWTEVYITSTDASLIKEYLEGQRTTFPIFTENLDI